MTIQDAVKKNMIKVCKAAGCTDHRHSLSAYCRKHEARRYNRGHHKAFVIRKRDYLNELEQVQNILDHNKEHEGINEGISYLDNLLQSLDTRVPCHRHLANLYDHGLRGEEMLANVSALYVLQNGNRGLIKSDDHFRHVVGSSVLKLRSQHGAYIKPNDKKALGEFLTKAIGTLCVTICHAVEQAEVTQRQRYVKFTQPLNIN